MLRILIITIFVSSIAGCSLIDKVNNHVTLSKDEVNDLTVRARQYILDNKADLGTDIINKIKNEKPEIAYYVLAGKGSVQYFVTWKINGDKELVLCGMGDIHKNDSFQKIVINKRQ